MMTVGLEPLKDENTVVGIHKAVAPSQALPNEHPPDKLFHIVPCVLNLNIGDGAIWKHKPAESETLMLDSKWFALLLRVSPM